MEKETFWTLLGKYLNGEITEKERERFERLIQEDNMDLSYLIEVLEEQWEKPPGNNDLTDKRLNEKWDRLCIRMSEVWQEEQRNLDAVNHPVVRRHRKLLLFWSKMAAAILILVGVSYYFFQGKLLYKQGKEHEIVVENGHKEHIVLPDGTSVWLNAGSKLTYNDGFAKGNRKVSIEGEALFNVEKNPSIPFFVSTRNMTIKVLGTVFNVEAYPGDFDIQTTLISGRIQVSLSEEPGKKILLSPHEKLTVNAGEADSLKAEKRNRESKPGKDKLQAIPKPNRLKYQVQTLPVNPIDSVSYTETAWVHDRLAFVNESFGSVAKKLERKYDVRIIFEDNKLKNIVMSGIFKKEKIGEALQVLQMITRFNYRVEGDSVFIYK